jgi:hypothetical protein
VIEYGSLSTAEKLMKASDVSLTHVFYDWGIMWYNIEGSKAIWYRARLGRTL